MKTVTISDVDTAALNRATDALYTAVEAWSKNRHLIDRNVAGGINDSLERSIKQTIGCYPEVRESYKEAQNHFIWLKRNHPLCKNLDYWISQWALTHYATTSPRDSTPDMTNFDSVYKQAKENSDILNYDTLRNFGNSAVLTGQFNKFMEIYNLIRNRA